MKTKDLQAIIGLYPQLNEEILQSILNKIEKNFTINSQIVLEKILQNIILNEKLLPFLKKTILKSNEKRKMEKIINIEINNFVAKYKVLFITSFKLDCLKENIQNCF